MYRIVMKNFIIVSCCSVSVSSEKIHVEEKKIHLEEIFRYIPWKKKFPQLISYRLIFKNYLHRTLVRNALINASSEFIFMNGFLKKSSIPIT